MRSVIVVLLTVFSHVLLPKEEEKSALSLFATNVWLDVFLNLSILTFGAGEFFVLSWAFEDV